MDGKSPTASGSYGKAGLGPGGGLCGRQLRTNTSSTKSPHARPCNSPSEGQRRLVSRAGAWDLRTLYLPRQSRDCGACLLLWLSDSWTRFFFFFSLIASRHLELTTSSLFSLSWCRSAAASSGSADRAVGCTWSSVYVFSTIGTNISNSPEYCHHTRLLNAVFRGCGVKLTLSSSRQSPVPGRAGISGMVLAAEFGQCASTLSPSLRRHYCRWPPVC